MLFLMRALLVWSSRMSQTCISARCFL
uniref:Uncharacterized protein n=1 Tax=Arundo donax TaxID=35708 RepID=A0A0A9FTH3_ARUDO